MATTENGLEGTLIGEQTSTAAATTQKSTKRKRKSNSTTVTQFCIREPPWTYLHLQHHAQPAPRSAFNTAGRLDKTTVSMFVDAALNQFLGLHGAAIPMDILRLDASDVWVRIPRQDRPAFMAALAGWIGRNGDALRIVGWSTWDASAIGRDAGQDLFGD